MVTLLSCGRFVKGMVGQLGGELWVEHLLSPRGPCLVGSLLGGGLAFVRVVASFQALLALNIGRC